MLSRYSMKRGRKLTDYPRRIREGVRQDTRKHTRHVLRPDGAQVQRYLDQPSDAAWKRFESAYLQLLRERRRREREAFDQLAERARNTDVYLGCNCPTANNPDPRRCHTLLALAFMREHYPELEVELEP